MYTNFGLNKPKNKERTTGKSLLYRKVQLIGRIFLLGNDQIAHLSIGSTPSAKHGRHQRASLIDVVVHMNFVLFRMLAVQPAGILDQSALEGERHRKEQGVKARKIVAFADKGCSREQNETLAARGLSPRGFTIHEMLDDLSLVHMNGRIYDPLLGRFLSADVVVQAPGNLQAYNRYSYVWNNPLTRIDPSGFQAEAPAEPDPDPNAEGPEPDSEGAPRPMQEPLNLEFVDPSKPQDIFHFDSPEQLAYQAKIDALFKDLLKGEGVKTGSDQGKIDPEDTQTSEAGNGRAGRQARLKELGDDPDVSSADRGWIKQERNSIARGKRDTIRNPPGKDLAHERGREAAKGFSYEFSNLVDRVLHKIQHALDDFGRDNAPRPEPPAPAPAPPAPAPPPPPPPPAPPPSGQPPPGPPPTQ
jgi:RHS repeat-associated protein